MSRPLREGDAIESVKHRGRMIPIVRYNGRLAFRATCGEAYDRSWVHCYSLTLDEIGPDDNALCLAQQLIAEGLVDGPEWE